jgi:hypothetical protein
VHGRDTMGIIECGDSNYPNIAISHFFPNGNEKISRQSVVIGVSEALCSSVTPRRCVCFS